MKKLIILLGFLLFGVSLQAQITPLQEAVDFTVTDVNNNEIHLFEILDGGQAVFIHFFLTYNFDPPIMPYMTEAYSIMGCNQHDVYFMEIAHREDQLECLQWIDRFHVEYPTISAEKGGLEVYDDYGITACPTLVLIMPDRSITIHGSNELYPFSTEDIVEALAQYGNLQPNECAETQVDENTIPSIRLFPNPANEGVTIQGEHLGWISIYNSLGQLMETINCKDENNRINIARYPNGLYFIRARKGTVSYFTVNH